VLQLSPGASAPVELPLTGLKSPHSIAVDRARTVYVTDRGNNRVVLMTADQTQRTLGLDGLAEPSGIAVDARGVIYIVDDGNDRILQATPLP
jgi:serine/threonine-protein kinase